MEYQNNQSHPNQPSQGQSSKKRLHPAVLAAIIAFCVIALWAVIFFGIHVYSDATCTAPEKCTICGKTRGTTTAHQWYGSSCTSPAVCSICGAVGANATEHSWIPATCTSAQYCAVCGLTSGNPTDHAWTAATCTNPAQCQICGTVSGSAIGHDWMEATHHAPQACSRCGATSGSPLPTPDINVENQVSSIRTTVNSIAANTDDGYYRKVTLREGVVAYYDGSSLKKVVVYRGTDGIGQYSDTYSRTYYFSGNTVIFAFFEGKDSHRLYFYEGALMRWRYTPQGTKTATNHDYDFSDEYYRWEDLALDEVDTFF